MGKYRDINVIKYGVVSYRAVCDDCGKTVEIGGGDDTRKKVKRFALEHSLQYGHTVAVQEISETVYTPYGKQI